MVTLVPFTFRCCDSRLTPSFPQRKINKLFTYHVFEGEAIHVEDNTSSFDGLMNNDTRSFHDVHGQKLNDFYGLIFLVMEVDIDEAKHRK